MRQFHLPVLLLLFAILAGFHSLQAEQIDLGQASKLVIEKTNVFRKEHDREPVQINEKLQAAAQKFADFMASNEKYGHHADGRSPAERVEAEKYEYCVVRENIAYRTDSQERDAVSLADHFTQGWIDSPEHRENMLADYITETAVAIATTDELTFYAVQLFGRPRSLAYRVELINQSDSQWTLKIHSNGSSDEIEVPPRGTLRMQRCFPITLSIVGTKAKKKLTESVNLIIVTDDEGPRLTPQPPSPQAPSPQAPSPQAPSPEAPSKERC